MEIVLLCDDNRADVELFLEKNISVATQLPIWSDLLSSYDNSIEPVNLVAIDKGIIMGILPGFFINTEYGMIYNSVCYPGGYGGVVTKDNSVYEVLLEYLVNISKQKGCILLTVTNIPWVNDYDLYMQIFNPNYVFKNFVNYIPLSKDLKLPSRILYDIRKAIRHEITYTSVTDKDNVDKFYILFEELMKHYGAFHFDLSFFREVAFKMATLNKAQFLFALKDNELISGILLLTHRNVIEYFHTASNPVYKALQPNSYLIGEGIKWGIKQGYKYWNFQSTRVRGNPTHKFKLRWGSHETIHHYYTKILGDCSELFDVGFERIRQKYPFYYFLPKAAFQNRNERFFEK